MARPRWETATYGDAPHEYVLRHQCPTTFKGYQDRIREHGITEKFTLRRRTATYRYYYPGDGIVRAPMTSVLMIFEMTQDYAVIVPLMLANLVSLFIASRLQHEPIYEALAVQDGIHLLKAETRGRHGQRQVARVMQTASQLLPAEITVREALERIRSSDVRTWLVADRRGVVGVINLARLERELAEGADKKLGELVDALAFPHVHPDQGLDLALERMGANQIEILPVVNRADVNKLEGIVKLRDVLNAYGLSRA